MGCAWRNRGNAHVCYLLSCRRAGETTECIIREVQFKAPTSTSDRVCATVRKCKPGVEWQTKPLTVTANRFGLVLELNLGATLCRPYWQQITGLRNPCY